MALLLKELNIKHPLLLAPMAGVSTPALAAEFSNHGGLGSLGLGANTPAAAHEQILQTQQLTDAAFQVNFFCHSSVVADPTAHQIWIDALRPKFEKFSAAVPTELNCIYPSFLDNDDYLAVVLETRPQAVSFHFGIPYPAQIQALKAAGIITMVTATNLPEATLIEQAGIDVIIAQGIEAGGHRGIFNPEIESGLHTTDLVQLILQHCYIPVVAAGGIMNGQQARKMLNIGAAAVQMGTAFVQCKSSNANTAYRQALFQQPLTQITSSISGRPARGLMQHWQVEIDTPNRAQVAAYPYAYDLAKQLNAIAIQHGDVGYGAFWAGSQVAQIRDLDTADLINQLILEMNS